MHSELRLSLAVHASFVELYSGAIGNVKLKYSLQVGLVKTCTDLYSRLNGALEPYCCYISYGFACAPSYVETLCYFTTY